MMSGFSMQAITLSLPPYFGQASMSMANTRFILGLLAKPGIPRGLTPGGSESTLSA